MLESTALVRDINVTKDGHTTRGAIVIGPVRKDDYKQCWQCSWRVTPGYPEESHVYGEDSLQALCLCIEIVDELIRDLGESTGVSIWWLEKGDCGGLLKRK